MSGQPKLYGIGLRQVNGVAVAWRVSIRRRGRNVGRLFSVKEFGNLKKALKAAIAFRDEVN
ncbi:AP2 domain-containing protein, partial [Corallococcus coralloides]|nr:AP2 domain-containing protein [Corallococcus coralloides]